MNQSHFFLELICVCLESDCLSGKHALFTLWIIFKKSVLNTATGMKQEENARGRVWWWHAGRVSLPFLLMQIWGQHFHHRCSSCFVLKLQCEQQEGFLRETAAFVIVKWGHFSAVSVWSKSVLLGRWQPSICFSLWCDLVRQVRGFYQMLKFLCQ